MNSTLALYGYGGMTNEQRIAAYTYAKDSTVNLGPRSLHSIQPNNHCTALVPYGTGLGSNIGFRLTSVMLQSLYLTKDISSIIVGSLLGDGNIRKMSANGAPL